MEDAGLMGARYQIAVIGHFGSKSSDLLGPGLITGASDDDPSGIRTYSQAGANVH
jgi:Mn2+/Fe2+ NRAMP family transporter